MLREIIKSLPFVRQLRKAKYDRKFENNRHNNLFRGVFDSFAQASARLPRSRQAGYDNKDSAALYKQWMNSTRLSDYPVLYWLAKIIDQHTHLYDLGGHIGFLYYSYAKYLNYRDDLEWWVYDVPAVVEEGKNIATQEKKKQLHFTSTHEPLNDTQILLASGSLQYIEQSLTDILAASASDRLKHVLVNMTPMHPDKEFFTVNSIGTAYCPYKIQHKQKFIDEMLHAGWKLVDEWQNSEKSCPIPFTDLSRNIAYYGFYFTKP